MKIIDFRIFKQIGLLREFKKLKFPKKPKEKKRLERKKKNVKID